MIIILYIAASFIALTFLFAFVQGYVTLFRKKTTLAIIGILVSALFWLIPEYKVAGTLFFAFNCFITAYAKILERKTA